MAACPTLGLLVTSDHSANTLDAVTRVGMFGDPECPVQFKFVDGTGNGRAALPLWLPGLHGPRHLPAPAGHRRWLRRGTRHRCSSPSSCGVRGGPRGVAARASLVAVSAWKKAGSGNHVVWLFEGGGACWTAVRVLVGGFGTPGDSDGQLQEPFGLRFTADGAGSVVAVPGGLGTQMTA
jgi:hypothetical protein